MFKLPSLKIKYRGLLIVSAPLIFYGIYAVVFVSQLVNTEELLLKESRARETSNAVQSVLIDATAFFSQVSPEPQENDFLKAETIPLENGQLQNKLDALLTLIQNDKTLHDKVKKLKESFARVTSELKEARTAHLTDWRQVEATYYRGKSDSLEEFFKYGTELWKQSSPSYQDLTLQLEKQFATLDYSLKIATLLSLALSACLAAWFANSITKPLQQMEENSIRLAEQKPLNTTIDSNNEIGSLDKLLHTIDGAIREANNRELELLQGSNDLICSITANGQINEANRASLLLLDIAPKELVGLNIFDLVQPEDIDKLDNLLGDHKVLGEPILLDLKMRKSNGTSVDTQWSIAKDKENELYFCVIRDLASEKEIERLKEEFFSMISNDLRSPLTSLIGSITMLKQDIYGPIPQQMFDELTRAERSAAKLIVLVNDLLYLGQLQDSKPHLNYSTISLESLLTSAKATVDHLSREKNIRIGLQYGPDTISVDRDKIEQVLINLLTNAIKHAPPNAEIEVSAKNKKRKYLFKISGPGPIIPEELSRQIFEPFFQLPGEKRGTGLGLSICKMIVEAHSGQIGTEPVFAPLSRIPNGNEFWFELPIELPGEPKS